MKIVSVHDVDMIYLRSFPVQARRRKDNSKRASDRFYYDVVTAFDIETTNIPEIGQSVMYIWQWAFGDDYVVTGRSWDELEDFMRQLSDGLPEERYFMVYVHNLSYEFHFMRGTIEWENVFAVDKRKVLKAEAMSHFEFRCSYLQSNMSLAEFTDKMQVEHKKLSGEEFDYRKRRFWWTPLTPRELEYCVNDVVGLVEAINKEMEVDDDNLYSIPLTSTGYVRRECKAAMRKYKTSIVKFSNPPVEVYEALRDAFRGGNTHANRFFSTDIVDGVSSYDRSSSYPDVQINCLFPVGQWAHRSNLPQDEIEHLIFNREKAVLMRVEIDNIRLRDKYWGCPYLSSDKCYNFPELIRKVKTDGRQYTLDNGRILDATHIETCITDVDYRILKDEYEWDSFTAVEVWTARYAPLPKELKDVIIKLYRDKTELKGVAGQEIFYVKQKNKLNSIYGMSAQDIAKALMMYSDSYEDLFKMDDSKDVATRVEEANSKAWFCYAWGVWTTAWARYRLEEGIRLVGHRFIYCDTDSVKYLGDGVDWTEYNNARIKDSKKNGAYATDPKGVTHYMGVYEKEDTYEHFVTLGAKKYAGIITTKLKTLKGLNYQRFDYKLKRFPLSDKMHGHFRVSSKVCRQIMLTISGVSKTKGAKELAKHGGLEALKMDFVFNEAGGTESIYNDRPPMTDYVIDGHHVAIMPNIYISDSTYKVGLSRDYMELLEMCDSDGIWITD